MDFPPSKLASFLLASPQRLQGSFFHVLQTDKISCRRNETALPVARFHAHTHTHTHTHTRVW